MNNEYGLGRLHSADTRDQLYPLKAHKAVLPSSRYYRVGPILDQGATPTCVGHAWRQWMASGLIMTKTGPGPFEIYHGAQDNDEWDGSAYDGTSVRGAAKYLQQIGHIAEYRWAWNVEDARDWVMSGAGTLVCGTDWYSDMFTPQSGYLIPGGNLAGGHAYLIVGYSLSRSSFRMVNSWGEDWGDKGRAWIHEDALKVLMQNNGEFCAAVEKKV